MNGRLILSAVGLIALSALTAIICSSICNSRRNNADVSAQSVYDRVLKSGKIRCAYVVYWPACVKDPNTGKLTGVHVEAMEAIGKELGLQIEWTEEVGWSSMIEGLQTNRYDVVGSGVWANATRGKYAGFSTPFYYGGPNPYCRINDHRFDKDLKAINSPAVRLATIDGEMSDIIGRTQFPEAQRISLPEMANVSQAFLEVADNKADIFIEDPASAYEYEKNNPNKLKVIARDKPLRVFGVCIVFRNGESKLQGMFDKAVDELVFSGAMDQILDKYEPTPREILLPSSQSLQTEIMQDSVPRLCGSIASIPNYLGAEMHNAAYAALGLPFTFVAFGTDDIAQAIASVRSLNIRGVGIGVPYKQAVMQYLDVIDPIAKEIGAVNIVVNNGGILTGYNVDWIGAAEALKERLPIADTDSIVVGAGGAARSIIYALTKNGAKVTIYNRNQEKAKALSDQFEIRFGGDLTELKKVTDYDILVNATSAGFYNKDDCAINPEIIIAGKIVFEAVHMPMRTSLVEKAEAKGAKVIYGYKMLLHLAGHAFKLFTLKDAPLDVMEKALMKRLSI